MAALPSDDYVLGRTDEETARLILQGELYAPFTRRLLLEAGLMPGDHVVDLGCGAGDVSLLAADIVGPRGSVLGVDVNAAILDTARRRAAAAGHGHVRFLAADLSTFEPPAGADAVIGRWVLMYVRDPAIFLARIAGRLRPGALLAFQESDLGVPPANHPPTPLFERLARAMIPPPGAPGPNTRMGADLHRTFVDAGLPAPALRIDAPIGAGPAWRGWDYLAATLGSLLPALERMGIDLGGVDMETLAEQLRDEAQRAASVNRLPFVIGAWARR